MPTWGNNSVALSGTDQELLEPSSGSLWGSVIESLPDCISIHSADGSILWANTNLCSLYGKSLIELRHLTCEKAFHREGINCPHEQVMATGAGTQLMERTRVSGKT